MWFRRFPPSADPAGSALPLCCQRHTTATLLHLAAHTRMGYPNGASPAGLLDNRQTRTRSLQRGMRSAGQCNRGLDHGREDRRQHQDGQVYRRRQGSHVSDLRGNDRPVGDRYRQVLRRDRDVHLRSRATRRPEAASPRSPISTATRASCSIAAIRSSSSPSTATSSKPAICCFTANCRPPRRRPTSTIASPATPWCTSR